MKKIIVAAALMCTLFVGCEVSSSASLTFNVETGDNINVELDTHKNDYELKADGSRFLVKEEDNEILKGIFLTTDMYDQYEASIMETGTILEDGDYLFYEYEGEIPLDEIPFHLKGVSTTQRVDSRNIKFSYDNFAQSIKGLLSKYPEKIHYELFDKIF